MEKTKNFKKAMVVLCYSDIMADKAKKVENKAEDKPTVADFKSCIKGTDLSAKDIKHNSTAIKYDRVLCYISDKKYGIGVWLVKESKTHRIENKKQFDAFVTRLNNYVTTKKSENKTESKPEKKE